MRPSTAGRPARSDSAYAAGRLTAALGRLTPGAPPPPTAAWLSTVEASIPLCRNASTKLAARPRSCSTSAYNASSIGVRGPTRVASRAASVSLSTRSARASGCRRRAWTRSARPSSSPACGPPSSLSPLAVTSAAPSRSAVVASGSSGSIGCGPSSPDPMSATTGTASPDSCRTGTLAVKPATTKLEGCTLSANPVSGPITAA